MSCVGSPVEFGQAVHELYLKVALERLLEVQARPQAGGLTDDDLQAQGELTIGCP